MTKYGIKKPPIVDFKTQGFFSNFFYLFGKKVIDSGMKKTFTREDLWNLPKIWTTKNCYPGFKAYFEKKMKDPNDTDRYGMILFKYVSASCWRF